MVWTQQVDPLGNIIFSAAIAILPVLFIFWALIIFKMKGHTASVLALLFAICIAIGIYGMPFHLATASAISGIIYGLFPICWIVISAVFLFNVTVDSGQFEVIKDFMSSITDDRRLQAILIAFCFGSFLEGMAGFGAPVAITAAMLVGLGFNPLYAAGICLIANTAPVAFGSIGIPITVASQVSGLPELALSQMVGRTLPFISIIIPFYLVVIISSLKRAIEVAPAILVCGITFAVLQFLTSNYLGPALPDIVAGIGSIISLLVLLRYWKPKKTWKFSDESTIETKYKKPHSNFHIIKASSPFILLTIIIIAWGIIPIKNVLDTIGLIQFEIPFLHNAIIGTDGNLLEHTFKFNYLSAAGTAIMLTAIISIPILGLTYREAFRIFIKTIGQLKYALLTITSIMGFAYVVNDSGITTTLAETMALTGVFFPLFAPLLGWLGVFITGSDTSSNALFGKLQVTTANAIGVDPVVTVAANVSGGVVGKMISPHSIAVATAAGGLVGQESKLFRFTLIHSFIFLSLVSLMVFAQAYLLTGLIPNYELISEKENSLLSTSIEGYIMLGGLFVTITGYLIYVFNKRKSN